MTTSPVLYPDIDRQIDAPPVVRLLGRTEYNGQRISLAMSCRQVFALLASKANTLVSVDQIRRELWGVNDPRSAAQTVQTYILHLRKFIGYDAIETAGTGYTLRLGSRLDVDALRFDHLVTQARRDMEAGDLKSAVDTLRAGFSLWNGRVLEDVRTGELLSAFATGVEDRHATALGVHYDIELRAGRHRDVVDELAALARSEPSREDWTERLMLALYRSRRAAEALQAYTRLRVALAEDHGMDPCTALRGLHAQIFGGGQSVGTGGEVRTDVTIPPAWETSVRCTASTTRCGCALTRTRSPQGSWPNSTSSAFFKDDGGFMSYRFGSA